MESSMEINEIHELPSLSGNQEHNKFICLFSWLDTKFEIIDNENNWIKRSDLQKYVITNCFDYKYYGHIDFCKTDFKKLFFVFNKRKAMSL